MRTRSEAGEADLADALNMACGWLEANGYGRAAVALRGRGHHPVFARCADVVALILTAGGDGQPASRWPLHSAAARSGWHLGRLPDADRGGSGHAFAVYHHSSLPF